jgi:hypothetical protein
MRAGNTCFTGYCDGIYGPVTAAAVKNLGSWYGMNNGGQMNNRTWFILCNYAMYYTPAAAHEMNCWANPSGFGTIY